MLTKTIPEENNTIPPLPKEIPENIQKNIQERWFHLYNWITPNEVKASIQRDYLHILSKIGIWVWGIAIIWALITWGLSPLSFIVFFGILSIVYSLLLGYLSLIAIKRSMTLAKSANVVLTDKAMSLGWEIINYDELANHKDDIDKIADDFDEPLFWESNLEKTKGKLFRDTIDSVWEAWAMAFKFIGNMDGRWKDTWQLILFLVVLGALYSWTMAVVYFAGLFFIWIFSIFITFLNKMIMRVSWHTVQLINDRFESIDSYSNKLQTSSQNLSSLLSEASKNNWQENLSGKIKDGIDTINKDASNAINESKNLRWLLENSKYKEIFNFTTFWSWLKKKIINPLENILALLEKNKSLIESSISLLENQIKETPDSSLRWPLELQKRRFESQKEIFEKQILMIQGYLDKLR